MSTFSPANQLFHEIVRIGTRHATAERWLAADQAARAEGIEYWAPNELCPETARKLIGALSVTIDRRFRTDLNSLRVRIRMAPSQNATGYFDASATLLHCPPQDFPRQVESMRSMAARLLSGLQRLSTDRQSATRENFLKETEAQTDVDELMESPLAPFLGTKLSEDLIAHISGRGQLEFKYKFRDAPQRSLDERTFDVQGKLLSVKNSGRSRSADIEGRCPDTYVHFKQPRVLYDETLRESIAQAVEAPWRKLLMSVTRTAVHCGRAKPLVTHTLRSLHFVD